MHLKSAACTPTLPPEVFSSLPESVQVYIRFLETSLQRTIDLGEQGMRMVKLKQKIGGCFRILAGGQIFCRIRSYLSTARKQGWSIWDALADAIRGHPRLLPAPAHRVAA